jgi:hypothetical protein
VIERTALIGILIFGIFKPRFEESGSILFKVDIFGWMLSFIVIEPEVIRRRAKFIPVPSRHRS